MPTSQMEPENDMDMIEDGLWIGGRSVALDQGLLQSRGITHIVTADIKPLPEPNEIFHYFYIKAHDLPSEDLLAYFLPANDFILTGLSNGAVLIHCFHGVSRSATIAAAFLIQKYKIGCEEALMRIKQARPSTEPNPGFLSQLQLYEKIVRVNASFSCLPVRLYRLDKTAKQFTKYGALDYTSESIDNSEKNSCIILRCKQCRYNISSFSQIILHKPGQIVDWKNPEWVEFSLADQLEFCRMAYFLELQPWLLDCKNPQGKFNCPKCRCKLGSYNWTKGITCPCGSLVNPAFCITASRVDVIRTKT